MSTSQARQLSVLWTRAHPIVAAYFRSQLRDYHRAEDLLQETAATAAEKFTTYDPARPFVAWVLGVARNKLLPHLRTNANDRHRFDDGVIERITAAYAEMEPELNAMQAALENCVGQVRGRARRLLEMRYVRDLTPSRIAALTGMTANAVTVMLHRVRKALRDCIERQVAPRGDGSTSAAGGA
ncbi:MAG TPA: sigma-70 family RNA polymerase sigma factor [Lacipirellulaceae bacterium]|nr:sigma-70 family RNA polymerase sigma factor [Lacipirellulaceae bacterium]